jgi:hypothetical protein
MNLISPRAGLGWLVLALAPSATPVPQGAHHDKKELDAIQAELQQEFKHLREATKDADEEESRSLYKDFQEKILPEFGERFAVIARAEKGTDLALDAWMKVSELASQGLPGELAGEALKTLVADHAQSEKLLQIANNLRYGGGLVDEATVLGSLRTLAEKSPHRTVQAAALFSLGAVLGDDRPAGDPRLAEAKAVFAKLAAYGDVKYGQDKTYAEAATAYVFALENLVAGKPCPDFAAIDAEGAGFKLSDYKGKVVLVDFWGFW